MAAEDGLMTTLPDESPASRPWAAGDPLVPYFPRLVIDWIMTTPEDRYREVESTVAFVDISGFTKLSEGLARHGKVGAEELTATINTCFIALLDLAFANGGRLLKFGGDALLLHFSGMGHQARACRAAVEMRRSLRDIGRLTVLGQKVSLRMSVGVHSGLFNFFFVGESHRELIVCGPAVSTVVTMEATADAGEIVISGTTARVLRPGVIGAVKGPGHLLRSAPSISGDPFVPFEPVGSDLDLSMAIPVGLREVLISAHQASEHRRVTLAFIHFDGIDRIIEEAGPAAAAEQLEVLVTDVQRAVDRHGVTFLGTDVDRDGGKIILTAGAPSTSGDDELRMLLAVREIMDAGGPLALRIGVNRGAVFAGEVGPPYRKTFTVMGDVVNLAARLMAKAQPGQVLVTPDVLSRSHATFDAVELEPFFVKGKAKPVRALSLGDRTGIRTDDVVDELPFVGRRDEMAELQHLVNAAREGSGTLIEIVGEPGVGKSRLADQLLQMASDLAQLSVVCERYESSTPYRVVRVLLRRMLRLSADGTDEDTTSQFLAALTTLAPSVLPWAPLIAGAIDLFVPETPETSELEEEFRPVRLAEAVVELLVQLVPVSALLLVEDAQYMDEASADLFRRIAAIIGRTPWLICVTHRDAELGFVDPNDISARFELTPFSTGETTDLAQLATRDAPMPPHQIGVIVERSGGNPLFLRELLAAARGGETVEALPDSIDEVIAARIDRLSADDRHLIRRISVLGQTSSFGLVRDVLDDFPDKDSSTWQRLDAFIAWDDRGNLSFRNGLLCDGAYNGLSYRLRRELHARTGDIIRLAAGDGGEESELLSLHYFRAQRYAEAWEYSLAAAERAKAFFANIEAAEFYERALLAGRRLSHVSSMDLSGVHESLGDARNNTGAYTEAAAAYQAARRLINDDPVAEARLVLKLARVQGWLDRYASALRWLTKGLRILAGTEGAESARVKAELLGWYGRFCQEEGHHRRAIKWCTLAVKQAEAAGATEALADALRVIDWAKMDLGQLEEPTNWNRSLMLFEELDDLPGQGGVLNMLGGFAYFRGDWEEALRLYGRAQSTVRRAGDAVADAFYVLNIGEIYLDQGRLEDAAQHFDTADRVWRAAGYRSGVAYVKCNLARVAQGHGRYDDALRLFEESIEESRHIGSQGETLEARARMAECLLLSGEPEAARSVADDALTQARTLGGVPAQIPLLQRVRGISFALTGQPTSAGAALEQSLAAARTRHAEYEVALTLRAMAEFSGDDNDDQREEWRGRAGTTLSMLGVISAPELPARRGLVR
jgi:class 3 adenylate cyclase/tetratricopeptide (TPR) repeat protein